jgi:hypothetical protein
VLLVALLALVPKLIIAARTYGTNDIFHWYDFLQAVHNHGPVGIYSFKFKHSYYNHPPLIGYYLWVLDKLQGHHLRMPLTLRSVSSVSDVVSAVLVFEILRRRRALVEATAAGVLVAISPVLFIISGFHGNTDPVFVMFVLLALHLLADRSQPAWAGAALGIAVGIKIVPFVVLPALLIYALIRGWRPLLEFIVGFAVVFGLSWGPALIQEHAAVRAHVIGYPGSGVSQWGLIQLAHWMGDPSWEKTLTGSGRFLEVLFCAAAGAVVVWWRPHLVAEAVGLSLGLFLFLGPAFGCQYLVWGMAASYLLSFTWATAYNLFAGITLTIIYDRWSRGFPWYHAQASGFPLHELWWLFAIWIVLGCACAQGIRRICTSPAPAGPATLEEPLSSSGINRGEQDRQPPV